jgi:hypothetical protein
MPGDSSTKIPAAFLSAFARSIYSSTRERNRAAAAIDARPRRASIRRGLLDKRRVACAEDDAAAGKIGDQIRKNLRLEGYSQQSQRPQ